MGASSSRQTMSAPVVVAATARHTATLIFLHGLGDTGHGWADLFRSLKLSNLKCVCPTAPIQPVTLNGRMRMPSWFDIFDLSPQGPEDEEGILNASNLLKNLIDEEIQKGISSERIVVGGFSQGGAVALYTAFTQEKPLAGIIALSTWMPLHSKFPAVVKGNRDIPILQCHGKQDPLVPCKWGEMTAVLAKGLSNKLEFKTYNMMHSSSPEEMQDVKDFLVKLLKLEES
ncbi:hypothetical protein CHS0354_007001 [Potamilus streckersoni]|uniref:palmitoyl-protein hydrolase n=1 Tax=Potamilus streckersoni TaxID=2493646 RepID=A0AAE0RWI8_9BIVA|nr:hypothetical protein CHS0354_007001 [Potamilus streckersoni]